jgi:hypothetical protein
LAVATAWIKLVEEDTSVALFDRAGASIDPCRLEHVPKKLLDFFDQDILQLFDFERFLIDHVIPRDREAL